MQRGLKIFFKSLILLIIIPIFYLFSAFILSYFPSSPQFIDKNSQTIHLLYNTTHSDIVLNLKQLPRQYKKNFPMIQHRKSGYLIFGWGDKETYLNTPKWADLHISTAIKALFINTPSLMHVQYVSSLKNIQKIKSIPLSNKQFKRLQTSIFSSFNFTQQSYKGYGKNDLFYSSPYHYNLFNTCNTWTGNQLHYAGISISYWTPLSSNLISSLP